MCTEGSFLAFFDNLSFIFWIFLGTRRQIRKVPRTISLSLRINSGGSTTRRFNIMLLHTYSEEWKLSNKWDNSLTDVDVVQRSMQTLIVVFFRLFVLCAPHNFCWSPDLSCTRLQHSSFHVARRISNYWEQS